jgi:hypothetical protein
VQAPHRSGAFATFLALFNFQGARAIDEILIRKILAVAKRRQITLCNMVYIISQNNAKIYLHDFLRAGGVMQQKRNQI